MVKDPDYLDTEFFNFDSIGKVGCQCQSGFKGGFCLQNTTFLTIYKRYKLFVFRKQETTACM